MPFHRGNAIRGTPQKVRISEHRATKNVPTPRLDDLCATPTPQDVLGTTAKYHPFSFTKYRAWKHTAGQDTDDEGEKDSLTPPRSPRASHRQRRPRRHSGSYHHIVAVQSMRAQLKTLDIANSGTLLPLDNAMQ